MASLAKRALHLLAAAQRPRGGGALNGFVEALLQKFEDCRHALSDEDVRSGPERVERFFADLYQKEKPRLQQAIRLQEPYLSGADAGQFESEVDELVRRVVIPSYVRLTRSFIPRERNGFYLTPESRHGLERMGWTVAGMLVGAFVVWAPFIPLWSKEWVIPFALLGLFFPNLRSVLSFRRYEGELNRLVERADREIDRLDIAYLTRRREQREVAAPAVRLEVEREGGAGGAETATPRRNGAKEGTS